MNRRSILTALAALTGSAAVAPVAIGAKTAAAVTGASLALNEPVGENIASPKVDGYWESPLNISFEATRDADYTVASGHAFPQFKSWGYGFRHSALRRDQIVRKAFERRCHQEEGFWQKAASLIGGDP